MNVNQLLWCQCRYGFCIRLMSTALFSLPKVAVDEKRNLSASLLLLYVRIVSRMKLTYAINIKHTVKEFCRENVHCISYI